MQDTIPIPMIYDLHGTDLDDSGESSEPQNMEQKLRKHHNSV